MSARRFPLLAPALAKALATLDFTARVLAVQSQGVQLLTSARPLSLLGAVRPFPLRRFRRDPRRKAMQKQKHGQQKHDSFHRKLTPDGLQDRIIAERGIGDKRPTQALTIRSIA